ncbi:MAG: immunity 53 family protein [Bryobacteraceae bacterium]
MQNSIEWLQRWYAAQCNGEWEHRHGVTIESLDNPGWMVKVDLTGTALEDAEMETHSTFDVHQGEARGGEKHNPDWFDYSVTDRQFTGAGGQHSLSKICDAFREFAETNGGGI